MPNICNYEMRIRGPVGRVEELIACLRAEYDYSNGGKPAHRHFFRVFSADEALPPADNGDGTSTYHIYGECAWSVHTCMRSGFGTYHDGRAKELGDRFMGTTLQRESAGLEVEVFSEEPGVGFCEHYLYRDGELEDDEVVDIEQAGLDDDGNPTTDIDWEEYDGDWVTINPLRVGDPVDGDYMWRIAQ